MRLLIEVEEFVSPNCRVSDSYILTKEFKSFGHFRRTERSALQDHNSPEDMWEFFKACLKVYGQFRKGLMGPGDEVSIDTAGTVRYWFTILEDAGKRTGAPWQNAYAFGPLSKLMTLTIENEGWPNRVMEAPKGPRPRMIPIGVGHDPDGNQW